MGLMDENVYFQLFAPNPIAVDWDIDECGIPAGSSVGAVVQNIKRALAAAGCIGPVLKMNAFGDMSQVDKDEFESAGLNLIHIPASEGKVKVRRANRNRYR